MSEWDFRVRGYAGNRHPRAKLNEFLGETGHKGVSSLQVEVMVWQNRIRNGDALYCQIIDYRPNAQPPLNVDALTTVDWKKYYG